MARLTMEQITKRVGLGLKPAIDAAFNRHEKMIEELAGVALDLLKRIDTLENSYQGVWDGAKSYVRNQTVTHAGSLWISKRETNSKPGTDDSWQLCVKKGRDGRDR